MARQRDPRREEAYQIWKQHGGKITNRAIAEQLVVPEKTISAWKSRDKWNVVLQPNKRSTTNKERVVKSSESKRYPNGHPGNKSPVKKFTERNQSATTHGLFSRYMPKETLEIMGMVAGSNPLDLLWMQIELQFSAIIRAQQIMFVEGKAEVTKVLKKKADADGLESREWEYQFAWDKQATFMNAQSRAMGELRSLIKQFDETANIDDDRRLKLEAMQTGIDKTKAELENLKRDHDGSVSKDWVSALKDVADRRKQMRSGEANDH